MGKKYKLAIGQSLSTVTKTFKAGQVYDAAEVGKSLNSKNRNGDPYFVEASEQESSGGAGNAPKGGITIKGKGQDSKAPQAPAGGDGGQGAGQGNDTGAGGSGTDTVTV